MVQITAAFVASVLLVAPTVLAAPVSDQSFEAREPLKPGRVAGGLSRLSGQARNARSHSVHEAGHRPSSHRLSHDSAIGSHRRLSTASSRRPAPLNLGAGSRRLRNREDAEEIEELSAREPFSGKGLSPLSGRRPSRSSGGLSPIRSAGHIGSHRLSGSHSEGHRHIGEHRATGLGRRPTSLGSARLGASRRLGGREDIEDIEELSAREPFSGKGLSPLSGRRPSRSSGGLSPIRSAGHIGSHRLSGSHSEGHRHIGEHRATGLGRRPTGLGSARLGASRRLGGREDIEDIEELSAREPFSGKGLSPVSGRRPSRSSGGLSPIRSAGHIGSHRLSGSHSEGHRHIGEHRATGLGRRPTGLGSARLGASRRLGGREDIEDVEELSAREPFSGKGLSPVSGRRPSSGGLSPIRGAGHIGSHRLSGSHSEGHRVHSGEHRATGLGRRPTGLGLARSRRIGVREDIEELMSRDLADFEEFSERDFEEIEELAARDPSVKEWFENMGKKIKHFFVGKKKPAAPAEAEAEAAVAARSVDDEMTDLFEREIDLD